MHIIFHAGVIKMVSIILRPQNAKNTGKVIFSVSL